MRARTTTVSRRPYFVNPMVLNNGVIHHDFLSDTQWIYEYQAEHNIMLLLQLLEDAFVITKIF